jgi:hypothetical protein
MNASDTKETEAGLRLRYEIALAQVAVATGIAIAWFDSRPRWDDAGITAGAMFLSAAVFALIAPRRPWLWGFALGLGVWFEFVRKALVTGHVSFLSIVIAPLVPVAFPMAGAYAALFVRRAIKGHRPA